jgi:hypothetical protein
MHVNRAVMVVKVRPMERLLRIFPPVILPDNQAVEQGGFSGLFKNVTRSVKREA